MTSNKFAFRRHLEELSSPVGLDDKFRHRILSYSYYLVSISIAFKSKCTLLGITVYFRLPRGELKEHPHLLESSLHRELGREQDFLIRSGAENQPQSSNK